MLTQILVIGELKKKVLVVNIFWGFIFEWKIFVPKIVVIHSKTVSIKYGLDLSGEDIVYE